MLKLALMLSDLRCSPADQAQMSAMQIDAPGACSLCNDCTTFHIVQVLMVHEPGLVVHASCLNGSMLTCVVQSLEELWTSRPAYNDA